MKKTTEELLKTLKNSNDIETYLEEEQEDLTDVPLCQLLETILKEKSLTPASCIKHSGLDRTYCYQIFAGKRLPSREKLLALCFAMKLSVEEVQRLLKAAGYPPLYPRLRRDSVILFGLEKNIALTDLNELLYDMNFPLLE